MNSAADMRSVVAGWESVGIDRKPMRSACVAPFDDFRRVSQAVVVQSDAAPGNCISSLFSAAWCGFRFVSRCARSRGVAAATSAAAIFCICTPAFAADRCAARSGAQAVPLVELYTSEGCSSCPPADRWLSAHFGDKRVNYLAFHVDYWDAIGWRDRFGSAAYSQRQRERVQGAGSRAVFTPQVMLGEQVQANWHSAAAFRAAVSRASQQAHAGLAMRALSDGSAGNLVVSASLTGTEGAVAKLWVARYVDSQVSAVAAGENRGATLRHDRVVRKLYGPWPLSSTTTTQRITLSPETSPNGAIAFVQSAQGQVLQSLDLPLEGCPTH